MRERLKQALREITRDGRIDYQALYPARVLKDHGDMTLDLRPDLAALPELERVPLRLPVPGAFVKVRPGARVLLAFERGDPSQPAAHLWQVGSLAVFEIATEGYKVRLDGDVGVATLLSPLASIAVRGGEVEVAALSVSVNAASIQLGGEAATFPVAVYGPAGLQPSLVIKGI